MVLRLESVPSFVPKVNTIFHRTQELILPTLCPNPKSSRERDWHSLDVKQALSFYLDQSKEFRKSEALFVLFEGPSGARKHP